MRPGPVGDLLLPRLEGGQRVDVEEEGAAGRQDLADPLQQPAAL